MGDEDDYVKQAEAHKRFYQHLTGAGLLILISIIMGNLLFLGMGVAWIIGAAVTCAKH